MLASIAELLAVDRVRLPISKSTIAIRFPGVERSCKLVMAFSFGELEHTAYGDHAKLIDRLVDDDDPSPSSDK